MPVSVVVVVVMVVVVMVMVVVVVVVEGVRMGEGTSKFACKTLWVAWHSPINRETPVFAQPHPSSRQ